MTGDRALSSRTANATAPATATSASAASAQPGVASPAMPDRASSMPVVDRASSTAPGQSKPPTRLNCLVRGSR